MQREHLLFYAFPIVVGIAALEAAILIFVRKRTYNWRASLASLADGVTRQYFLKYVVPFNIAGPAIYLAATHPLDLVPFKNPFLSFAVLFFGQELAYYWFHRASHRMRWLWASHAVHHSPNELNFSAAYRIGVTGWLSGGNLFFIPLIWLGFSPQAVFGTVALNLLYQFWIHAEWIPKLGPLEYVLNTPSHHRVHHAANLDYLDANYGGVLIIFDRIFGTLVVERADEPCRYGLVKPLLSNNPLYIDFHEWISLAKDLGQARSPRDALGYMFGPPGWRPYGEGLTTEAMRRAAAKIAVDRPVAIAAE
jgi:sterol desaturase/sphingolipid hydroxylase (fatty acid hydroxylase superfamily)